MEILDCDQLLSSTLGDADPNELAGVLRALADPVGLKLVNVIVTSGEACAGDLPGVVDKTKATSTNWPRCVQ